MINMQVGGGDAGGGGQADAKQHYVEAGGGDPPKHSVRLQLPGNSKSSLIIAFGHNT